MASFAKQLSFFFLIFLLSSVQTQGRVSKFFAKLTHANNIVLKPKFSLTTKVPTPAPALSESPELAPVPSPAPFISVPTDQAPEPAPVFVESENRYGLYGHGSDVDVEDENLEEEEENGERFETRYEKTNLYSNNGYTNNYNNNNNGYTSNYNYNNNGNKGYETERQGMSDTRYLENGKYYYSPRNVNNYKEGLYGNSGNEQYPNEYNSMEEYENQEYQKSQQYVP